MNRPRAHGGDWITFDGFARELQRRDAEVRFSSSPDDTEVQWADVVHTYNITFPWSLQAITAAQRNSRPSVVTSIFFHPKVHPGQSASGVRAALDLASGVLVYNEAEATAIRSVYPGTSAKFMCVEKGHDSRFLANVGDPRGIDVLCVGSIEPRKGQLGVISACNSLGIAPIIVGPDLIPDYARKCRQTGSAVFTGRIERDVLPPFYAAARVFVQASVWDPQPNTVIEAALAGCNVVVSNATFFGELPGVQLCDPMSVDSIRAAIDAAVAAPPTTALQDHVRKRFSWERAVDDLLGHYRTVVLGAGREWPPEKA